MSNPLSVYIDWNDDLDYSGTHENVTEYLRGPYSWSTGKDQYRSFAPGMAGQFGGLLDNRSGLFSSWDMGGALYSRLHPGHRIQIELAGESGGGFDFMDGTVFDFVDGTSFDFIGTASRIVGTYILDDLRHQPERENLSVAIPGLGPFSRLKGKTISTALYQNITTSDALEILLDAAGWPALEREIQTGQTVMAWWWLDNEDAFEAAEQLKLTEGPGASWYERAGCFCVFENRDSRTTQTRSTTPQATFIDNDWHVQGLAPTQNYKDVIQACKIVVEEMEAGPLAEIWNHGSDLVLAAGETRVLEIRSSGGPFLNAQVPDPTPSNTIWVFRGSQPLTAGTFKLEHLGQTTSAINWDASGSTIATALQALSTIGAGNASGTGTSLNSGIYIELIGDFAGLNVTVTPTIVESTLNPVNIPGGIRVEKVRKGGTQYAIQELIPEGVLTAGTIIAEITTSGGSTGAGPFDYDADAATIVAAFVAAPVLTLVNTTCDGGPLNIAPITINLQDVFEDIEKINLVLTGVMMQAPSATVEVAISQPGGIADYVVTAGSVASITLDRTSGVSALETITAGPGGLTATGLRTRAQTVAVVRTHQVTHPMAAISPNARVYQPNVRSTIPLAFAQTYTELVFDFYKAPRTTGETLIETPLDDMGALDSIFQRRTSDMVAIQNTHLGLAHNVLIEQITHETGDGEELHVLTRIGWEMAA